MTKAFLPGNPGVFWYWTQRHALTRCVILKRTMYPWGFGCPYPQRASVCRTDARKGDPRRGQARGLEGPDAVLVGRVVRVERPAPVLVGDDLVGGDLPAKKELYPLVERQ
jgi:hypothetical protein